MVTNVDHHTQWTPCPVSLWSMANSLSKKGGCRRWHSPFQSRKTVCSSGMDFCRKAR